MGTEQGKTAEEILLSKFTEEASDFLNRGNSVTFKNKILSAMEEYRNLPSLPKESCSDEQALKVFDSFVTNEENQAGDKMEAIQRMDFMPMIKQLRTLALLTPVEAKVDASFIKYAKEERLNISKALLSDWLNLSSKERVAIEDLLIAYDQMFDKLSTPLTGQREQKELSEITEEDKSKYHKCQYCGAMTNIPDSKCLFNPAFQKHSSH